MTAVRTLRDIYVSTPSQSLQIVYASTSNGNVCMEYLTYDARELGEIRYTVFEKNAKFMNYDLAEGDIADRCSMTGVDLTTPRRRS